VGLEGPRAPLRLLKHQLAVTRARRGALRPSEVARFEAFLKSPLNANALTSFTWVRYGPHFGDLKPLKPNAGGPFHARALGLPQQADPTVRLVVPSVPAADIPIRHGARS